MINIYLKQAWVLMKQNKLFTGIYVIGTGLSIALVMTLFIIYYVKFAPVYPEYNRNRMLVVKPVKCYPKRKPDNWNINGGVSYHVIKDLLPGLPHLEALCGGIMDAWNDDKVALSNGEVHPVTTGYVDAAFWTVFSFNFLNGKPFSQADFESNLSVAVLSESLARRIFASADVVGKRFIFNGNEFSVCGIVEDVSNATPETAADLWMPLYKASYMDRDGKTNTERLIGNVHAYLLAPTAADKDALRKEVQDLFRKFNLQNKEYDNDLMGQPDDYWVSTFRQNMEAPDMTEIVKSFLYLLLALLFIPALNLSGMISSRMRQRLCELGVRKAYGANNSQLMQQVLWENFLLSCLGGFIGLVLSYLIVVTASDWILTLFDQNVYNIGITVSLTPEMLFNPYVFIFTFSLCVLLNIVSAMIPAAWSLRRSIIQSLNTNR